MSTENTTEIRHLATLAHGTLMAYGSFVPKSDGAYPAPLAREVEERETTQLTSSFIHIDDDGGEQELYSLDRDIEDELPADPHEAGTFVREHGTLIGNFRSLDFQKLDEEFCGLSGDIDKHRAFIKSEDPDLLARWEVSTLQEDDLEDLSNLVSHAVLNA